MDSPGFAGPGGKAMTWREGIGGRHAYVNFFFFFFLSSSVIFVLCFFICFVCLTVVWVGVGLWRKSGEHSFRWRLGLGSMSTSHLHCSGSN